MRKIIGSLQRWSGERSGRCENGPIQEGLTERRVLFRKKIFAMKLVAVNEKTVKPCSFPTAKPYPQSTERKKKVDRKFPLCYTQNS